MTERMLRNTPATVFVTFYAGESAADADAGVTDVVKKADGTTLLSGGASHEGPVGSGRYSELIPPQSTLDNLTVEWTGTFAGEVITLVSDVEIVGGFYFGLAELRAFDSALTVTRFPLAKLSEKRAQVEAEFEDVTGRAFVPRFARETGLRGEGGTQFWLGKPDVLAITKLVVDGTDQTAAWVTAGLVTRDNDNGQVLNLTGDAIALSYADSVTIEYEYGHARPPTGIKEAALKRARGFLLGQNATIDERATVMSIPEFGTFNLSTPGQRGAHTGIPEIDVVLNRYMHGSKLGAH
jgi:hypothetical protein